MNVGNVSGFNTVTTLKVWVSHVLPLVYDDTLSFMELLGKVTYKLNELIENNNKLPDYIADLIREYISSGEIEKVLAEVLANYMLNVKFPPAGLTPATGDGSADDTVAIQGCIDYAFNHGGMAIYFPSGSYLTQPLVLKNKCTMFGYDRYNTRLVLKGGATTAMFTGNVDELSLTGIGFDGNMDIQVNNVNLFDVTVGSAIITNVLLTDGYDLLKVVVNRDLQLDDVIFNHAVENGLVVSGDGYVQADNIIFKTVSALIGKNYVVLGCNDSILTKVKCEGASPNGVRITGNNNIVKMWNEGSTTAYVDEGQNNSVEVYTVSDVQKFSGGVERHVSGTITDTAGSNVSETVGGKKTVQAVKGYEEIIGAGKTVNVTGNFDEAVSGDKGETAMNINDTSVASRTETTGTNKTVIVTGNFDEAVSGDKGETAMNINDTSVASRTETTGTNKTVIVKGNDSEDITGTKTENVGSNKQETVGGTKVETITGMSTENANGGKVVKTTDYVETIVNRNVNAGTITETITGNKTVTASNYSETIAGDKTTISGDISETCDNKNVEINSDFAETVVGTKSVTADELKLILQKPLGYNKPIELNEYFSSVKFSENGVPYDVLVKGANLDEMVSLINSIPSIPFPYVNVKDFGAKGDGLTNDTVAVQAALDSGSGCVWFPAGTYMLNRCKIPSNTIVMGDYPTLKAIGSSVTTEKTIFTNKSDGTIGGYNANENIVLKNLIIDGNWDSVSWATTVAFSHCKNVFISECVFKNVSQFHMIEINGSKHVKIENCYFSNYGKDSGYTEMVQLDKAWGEEGFPWFGPYDNTICSDIEICGCSFEGNPDLRVFTDYDPCGIGNHISGTEKGLQRVFIHNNYFFGLTTGIKLASVDQGWVCENYFNLCCNGFVSTSRCMGVSVKDNQMYLYKPADATWGGNGYGVRTEYNQNAFSNIMVVGNRISGGKNNGIAIMGSNHIVKDNYVSDMGGAGIYLGYFETGSLYDGNTCFGCSLLNSGLKDLHMSFAQSGELRVGDNVVQNNKVTNASITDITATTNIQPSYYINNVIKGSLTDKSGDNVNLKKLLNYVGGVLMHLPG